MKQSVLVYALLFLATAISWSQIYPYEPDTTFDTTICTWDTMVFCPSSECALVEGSKSSTGGIIAIRDGVLMPSLLTTDESSPCSYFIPSMPGEVTICQDNYYDGENCYYACWNIHICCSPQGSLYVNRVDTLENSSLEYNVCFDEITYPCDTCCGIDSIKWTINDTDLASHRDTILQRDWYMGPGQDSIFGAWNFKYWRAENLNTANHNITFIRTGWDTSRWVVHIVDEDDAIGQFTRFKPVDWDGDGDKDVIGFLDSLFENNDSLFLWKNMGSWVFERHSLAYLPCGAYPIDLQLFDFDDDGDLDIFAATSEGLFLLKNSSGSLEIDTIDTVAYHTVDIKKDRTGQVVLLAIDTQSGYTLGDIHIFLKDSLDGFEETYHYSPSPRSGWRGFLTDFNNDGLLDFVYSYGPDSFNFSVTIQLADTFNYSSFTVVFDSLFRYTTDALSIADFDSDGDIDVLTHSGYHSLYLIRNDRDSTDSLIFTPICLFNSPNNLGDGAQAVDIDADGLVDIVDALDEVSYIRQDSAFFFSEYSIWDPDSVAKCHWVMANDFDEDGDLDILLTSGGYNAIYVFENKMLTFASHGYLESSVLHLPEGKRPIAFGWFDNVPAPDSFNISYYYRTGGTIEACTTSSWEDIDYSGDMVSGPPGGWFQYKIQFDYLFDGNPDRSPRVDSVYLVILTTGHDCISVNVCDTSNVSLTSYNTCSDLGITCSTVFDTTFPAICGSLAIDISPDSIFCEGETTSVRICANPSCDTCSIGGSIQWIWTTGRDTLGMDSCIEITVDTTTTVHLSMEYQNLCYYNCQYDTNITIVVVREYPDSLCYWPLETTLCVGETLELEVPCLSYTTGQICYEQGSDTICQDLQVPIDSTVVFTVSGADTDTLGTYSFGDWCQVYCVASTSGCPLTTVHRDIYVHDCVWHDSVIVFVCDTPSAAITLDNILCPQDGLARVCVNNLNPSAPIDEIHWHLSTGDIITDYSSDSCIDVPLRQIHTACMGYNSFEPETVITEISNSCCGHGACWISDTMVVKPYFDFGLSIFPNAVPPGNEVLTFQTNVTPELPDTIIMRFYTCDSSYIGAVPYYEEFLYSTALDSTTVYCANFIYEGCSYWTCDTVFVSDRILTIIKVPFIEDDSSSGYIEVDGRRRENVCSYTFPVYDSVVNICVNDIEDYISEDTTIDTVYHFSHWESSGHSTFSYNSCTVHHIEGDNDTIYAYYSPNNICLRIENCDTTADTLRIEIDSVLSANSYIYSILDEIGRPRFIRFINCGTSPFDIQAKWISNTITYEHPLPSCSSIDITNYPSAPGKISLRAILTDDTTAVDHYYVLKNYYTNVYADGINSLLPGDTLYMYLGAVSSYYSNCPRDENINLKIKVGISAKEIRY